MESSDSSPDYMKATSGSRAKKENSPGENEIEDTISVSSSHIVSAINGQYAARNKSGITCGTNNKKTLKSLGNARSFRRRAKSRILQPIEMSDNSSASCHESLVDASLPQYLKSTNCSQGKKLSSQSSSDGSGSTFLGSKLASSRHRSFKTLSRTSSIRNVRILIKKSSFKPGRHLIDHSVSEDVVVDRATYSSTVKDSKFPQPVEVPFDETESGKNSGMKVCRYNHCSLHSHCPEDHDVVSPPKRFLHKKRQPFTKPMQGVVKTGQCSCETKGYTCKMKNNQKSQMVSIAKSSVQEGELDTGMEIYVPFNDEQNSEACVEGYGGVRDFDFLEIAFGETSFPERSYEDNLIIMRKYSPQDQQIGGMSPGLKGYCLKCYCKDKEQSLPTPRSSEHAASSSLDKDNTYEIPLNRDADVFDSHSLANVEDHASFITDECKSGTSSKDCPETPVVFDEVTKDRSVSSSISVTQTLSDSNSEVEGELTTISSTTGDSITSEVVQIPESGNASASGGNKLQFSKPRHMSMWHLIHQHMASELATVAVNKPHPAAEDQDFIDNKSSFLAKGSLVASRDFADSGIGAEKDSETQEIEIRKLFAIKLVREAIEKILLPEFQDDLSITSENISPKECNEGKQNEDCTEESYGNSDTDKGKDCMPSTSEEMSPIIEDSFSVKMVKTEKSSVSKSDKKAPKHWSNLKKWILLQRFIRELEKVREFNPRKPRQLPISPDPKAEKVNLRPLALDEKKRGEEWMLDYALRQAVNELAPTQKQKVALLVKAFETVVPPQEDNQIRHRRSATWIKKYSNILTSNDVSGAKVAESPCKSECGDSEPSVATKSLIINDTVKSVVTEKSSERKDTNGAVDDQVDRKDHIKMWHMIYQHVVSGIAEKIGSRLLDGSDDEDDKSPGTTKENHVSNNSGSGFTKSDALKLVKEAVADILLPDTQGNTLDSVSVCTEQESSEENTSEVGGEEKSKPKNWKKLKKLLLLKKSIKALEKARERTQTCELLTQEPDSEPERVDLKRQMMDEKKKAEQWMLDYAVQHIVTKLNPARKLRVSMLVEAFEAVVPFPEI